MARRKLDTAVRSLFVLFAIAALIEASLGVYLWLGPAQKTHRLEPSATAENAVTSTTSTPEGLNTKTASPAASQPPTTSLRSSGPMSTNSSAPPTSPPSTATTSPSEFPPLINATQVQTSQIHTIQGFGVAASKLTNQKVVALTFDDGPSVYTAQVLDILKRENLVATFCMTGSHVQADPQTARNVRDAGMGICNHTQNHDLGLLKRSPATIDAEIANGATAIHNATGVWPTLFRAPGGATTQSMLNSAAARGERTINWNVDPKDWSQPGSDVIVRRVMAQAHPGSIILMHDGDGNGSSSRAQSIQALPQIIARLKADGYSCVNLASLG